jgi:hypothetical protein
MSGPTSFCAFLRIPMLPSQAEWESDFSGAFVKFVSNDTALQDVIRVIFGLVVALVSISCFLQRTPNSVKTSSWFAPKDVPSKRACEMWFLCYSIFWVSCFGFIIASQVYLKFSETDYMLVCGGLATPLLIQPLVFPSVTGDQGKPIAQRHSFKANLWIFVFGFIGNYWCVCTYFDMSPSTCWETYRNIFG